MLSYQLMVTSLVSTVHPSGNVEVPKTAVPCIAPNVSQTFFLAHNLALPCVVPVLSFLRAKILALRPETKDTVYSVYLSIQYMGASLVRNLRPFLLLSSWSRYSWLILSGVSCGAAVGWETDLSCVALCSVLLSQIQTLMWKCVWCQGEVHGRVLISAAAGRGLSAHMEPYWRQNCQSCESRLLDWTAHNQCRMPPIQQGHPSIHPSNFGLGFHGWAAFVGVMCSSVLLSMYYVCILCICAFLNKLISNIIYTLWQ